MATANNITVNLDTKGALINALNDLNDAIGEYMVPKKIIKSGDRTIVFWKDDTKTIVRRSDDTADDLYSAFCASLAKKVYGSNSQVKKILRMADIQPMSDRLRKKAIDEYNAFVEQERTKEEAERPQKILNEYEESSADKVIQAVENSFRRRRRRAQI